MSVVLLGGSSGSGSPVLAGPPSGGSVPGTPAAALTGTATQSADEDDVAAGGLTIVITLTHSEWLAAAGGVFDAVRQDILDGLDSAQSEAFGWNAEVRDKENVSTIARTSDTIVTITLSTPSAYGITANEVITVTVPDSAVTTSGAITATPTITITQVTAACTLSGTFYPSVGKETIVAGGKTAILTLVGGQWIPAGSLFDNQRQAIVNGLTSAQGEANGWNVEVRDKEVVTAVARTNNAIVTVTQSPAPLYDITTNETITATVPASALLASGSPIIASPTFQVATVEIDEPLYNPAIHTNLFYDDFSSYDLGVAESMFDGSGLHTWVAAQGNDDDARRTIVDGSNPSYGNYTGVQTSTLYEPPEGSAFGTKFLRGDYRYASGIGTYINSVANSFPTDSYNTAILTFYVRNVGVVYYSKLMEFFPGDAGGTNRVVFAHRRNGGIARWCWWDADYPHDPLDPLVTPNNVQYIDIDENPEGAIMCNMGGPNWDINTYGVASHPCELVTGHQWAVGKSSNEWWRYTIRVTRDTGNGDGRYEIWQQGSHPGLGEGTPDGYGRRMTGVKIMDINGAAGNCEAGVIHTTLGRDHIFYYMFFLATTSGHAWPDDSEGAPSDGCYIDIDSVRIWTEE